MRPSPAAAGRASHPAQAHAIAADQPVLGDLPGAWLAALRGESGDAHDYLLLLRFGLTNALALGLLGVVWLQGWIDLVLAGDSTRLVLVIAAVFAAGLVLCGRKVWQTSIELNQVKQNGTRRGSRVASYLESVQGREGDARAIIASALRLKLAARISPIRHIANSLVFLGLIGTVIGFIIALSGVDAKTAADVTAVGTMVSTLISGMSVALYTTLVGAVLNVWLMVNYRLLESGTVRLITAIVELGERHVRS